MSKNINILDWNGIREHVQGNIDTIRPATYDEMMDAVEAVHGDKDLPMAVLESAVDAGILNRKGEGLDDTYTFNLKALDADEDADDGPDAELDDGRKYAPSMVARDSWILYEEGKKQVKAPWKTGDLYNAPWGEQLDVDERPETDFATALNWSRKARSMNIQGWEDCESVHPGYLLQREVRSPGENIAMIDLDDVRDPERGYIVPEARDIIDRASSYAEVSMSGAGVHIFVFGHLPESFPSQRLVEDLHTDEKPTGEQPKVEIYQRRRIAITTGNHIEGTPDDVTDGHRLLAELVDEYYEDNRTAEDVLNDLSSGDNDCDFNGGSRSEHSAYFDVDPASLLSSGSYRKVGQRVQGPHPYHGSSGGSDYVAGGRNFSVERGVWTCYRHGSGGNALHLVAVMEEYIECEDAGKDSLELLSDEEYAQLCLDARDTHQFSGEPPYRALLGLAKAQCLAPESAEQFDFGLRDLLLEMFEGATSDMLAA